MLYDMEYNKEEIKPKFFKADMKNGTILVPSSNSLEVRDDFTSTCRILQSKAADPDSDIAPPGFEYKEIPFLIILDEHGNFIGIEDTREKNNKKLIGKKFRVPQVS